MYTIDKINAAMGRDYIRYGIQGFNRSIHAETNWRGFQDRTFYFIDGINLVFTNCAQTIYDTT